jgi:hypothetical protein
LHTIVDHLILFLVVYLLSLYFLSDFDSDELELLARSGDEESAEDDSVDDEQEEEDDGDDDDDGEEGDDSSSEEDDIDEKEDVVKNFELSDSD